PAAGESDCLACPRACSRPHSQVRRVTRECRVRLAFGENARESTSPRHPEARMRNNDRSVLVTLLALAQIVGGVSLLSCGVFSLVAAVAGTSSATVTITNLGKSTTRTYDTREEMEKEAPGYKLFLTGSAVVGILLHLAMLVGAVGLLAQRAWGWWLSLAWALLQLVCQVLTLGYLWSVAMPAANRLVQNCPRHDNPVCSRLVDGHTLYHVFCGLF